MLNNTKFWLSNFPSIKIFAYIIDDFVKGLKFSIGQIDAGTGAAHSDLSEKESITYLEKALETYKIEGKIEKFSGTVAELGPGDSAGVGMLMRAEGCTQVDLIDRFYSNRDLKQQSKIYQLIADKYDLNHLKTTDFWDEQKIAGINWKIGEPAEVYFRKCVDKGDTKYDNIVSCAVLEHLYDPLDCLQQMVACLKPGGNILHIIDFRDHGMFTPVKNELFFLQIPSLIYPLIVKNTGKPNRILVHRYRDVLESMKQAGLIDYSILVMSLVGGVGRIYPAQKFEDIDLDKQNQAINFVEKHRHKFAKEFNHVDSKDLAVSGILLKVNKK